MLVAAVVLAGCSDDSGESDQSRVSPTASASASVVLKLTATEFGPVQLGTDVSKGEPQLRALLGEPTNVSDQGCELSPERGRWLTWGSAMANFTDEGGGGPFVLTGWSVRDDEPPALDLPYGVEIGTPAEDVQRLVPKATGAWNDTLGIYETTTADGAGAGLTWLSEEQDGRGPVVSIALNLTYCE